MPFHLIKVSDLFFHPVLSQLKLCFFPRFEAFEMALYQSSRVVFKFMLASDGYHLFELSDHVFSDDADGVESSSQHSYHLFTRLDSAPPCLYLHQVLHESPALPLLLQLSQHAIL